MSAEIKNTKETGIDSYIIKVEKPIGKASPISDEVEAFLFLHGFPADRGTKNHDIAEAVTNKTGINSFVLHYRGLGKAKAGFSFTESVKESLEVARFLIDKYKIKKLHLVGHSWGGLVALNIFKNISEAKIGNLILLAPFSVFPNDNSISDWLDQIEIDSPNLFLEKSRGFAKQNFYNVKNLYDPVKIAKHVKVVAGQVKIIEALNDAEVPNKTIHQLASYFNESPCILALSLDHSFLNDRQLIIKSVIDLLVPCALKDK